jgi:hypothetical protein
LWVVLAHFTFRPTILKELQNEVDREAGTSHTYGPSERFGIAFQVLANVHRVGFFSGECSYCFGKALEEQRGLGREKLTPPPVSFVGASRLYFLGFFSLDARALNEH